MDPYGVAAALKQRKLADALRKQAESQKTPEGQMVSNHFVAPHWSQYANQLATTLGSAWAGNKAEEAETAAAGKAQTALDASMADLPKAEEAQMGEPAITGLGGRERMEAPVLKQANPLTFDRVFKKYAEIKKNPLGADVAEGYLKGAQTEAGREDTQKAALAKAQMEVDARYGLQSVKGQQAMDRETLKNETVKAKDKVWERLQGRKLDIESQKVANLLEAAKIRAKAASDKATGKPVNPTISKELTDASGKMKKVVRLASEFKPSYAGIEGAVDYGMGQIPFVSTEAAEWWKNYKKESELIERHGLFGSALTAGEATSWRAADIQPWMDEDAVARNLERRAEVMAEHFEAKVAEYEALHHDVRGAFPKPVAPGAAPTALPLSNPGRASTVVPGPVIPQANVPGAGQPASVGIPNEAKARLDAKYDALLKKSR